MDQLMIFSSHPLARISLDKRSHYYYKTLKCERSELRQQLQASFAVNRDLLMIPTDFVGRAVFFDMDATVIAQETIVELARENGTHEEVARITEEAMAGHLDFRSSLLKRVATLRGANEGIIEHVYNKLTLNPGLEELLGQLHKREVLTFLISGGFKQICEPLAKRLGFHDSFANTLAIENGRLTGSVSGPVVDAQMKADWMQSVCKKHQIRLADVIAIGDGANDLEMVRHAGLGIGYCAKPVLWPYLDGFIGSGDHRFLSLIFSG